MKVYNLTTKIFIFSTLLSLSQTAKAQMKEKINAYLQKLPTEISVSMSVENLKGKKLFVHNEQAKVPSASVIKIPIMIELMEQAHSGKINLGEKYILNSEDKTGGSGIIANEQDGIMYTIEELCREMIRVSDNTATNILIKKVGMENINARLEQLGAIQTRLNRVMMDTEAVKQGRENWVNTLEINELLRKIYANEVASPQLCNLMINILKKCEDNTTIPRNLPKELTIAHKTGGLPYVRGDAAIIYTEKPIILSIFVQGFKTTEEAEKIIGDLAALVVNE